MRYMHVCVQLQLQHRATSFYMQRQNNTERRLFSSSDVTLTVIVAPLALGGGLRDAQQAADGVGGAQGVRLRRLGRCDR